MADTLDHRSNQSEYENNKWFDNTYVTVMDGGYTTGMSTGRLMTLRQMIEDHKRQKGKGKFQCPCSFMHDLRYHEIIEHKENFIKHYNGCATVDVDPPKDEEGLYTWSYEHTLNVIKSLNEELRECPHLVLIEPSFSGKGIHLMFGRHEDRYTEEGYFMFVGYCMNIVADALIKLNFSKDEVVGVKSKLDSKGQLLDGSAFDLIRKFFYSYKNVYCNEKWNPLAPWSYEKKYDPIDNKLHSKLGDASIKIDPNTKFDIPDTEKIKSVKINIKDSEYSDDCTSDAHENRLKICATVLRMSINNFGKCDKYVRETALRYVLSIAEVLWKEKVDENRYNYCIKDCTNKVMRTLKENCYANRNVLCFLEDMFGIKEIDPNIFYLNEDEYLYDIIDKIPFKTGINLLISGTGTGKTECWKKLTEWNPLTDKQNKVVVCEPYISIIESKYDRNKHHKAYGSVRIDNSFNTNLTVTNYNKIILVDDDEFEKIDYLVIDESHLLFVEGYRWDVLNKFIKKLIRIKDKCKIILQTATPAFETQMFDIMKENIFTINKSTRTRVTISYMNSVNGKYTLWNAYKIANNWLDENICDRVFIYNGSGGFLDNYSLPDSRYKVGIYHKKNPDTECIEYIDDHHEMGEYKILISSCWFGVGHDLHDKGVCGVIICGNNPYHEEVQCIGRFRDAKEIKCVVMAPDYNRHDNIYKSYDDLRSFKNKMSENNKYNSFIMSDGTSGHIREKMDCYIAWYMTMYGYKFNNIKTKFEMYEKLGFNTFIPVYIGFNENIINSMMNCKCKLKETFHLSYRNDDYRPNIMNIGTPLYYKHNYKEHKKGEFKSFKKYGFIRKNSLGTYDIYQSFVLGRKFDKGKRDEYKFKEYTKKIEILCKLNDDTFIEDDFKTINEEFPNLERWCKTVYGMAKHENDLFKHMYKQIAGHCFLLEEIEWYRYALRYINVANSDDYDIIENILVEHMISHIDEFNQQHDGSRMPVKDKDTKCYVVSGVDLPLLFTIYHLYGFDDKKIMSERVDSMIKLFEMSYYIASDEYYVNWFKSKLNIRRKSNFIDYILSDGKIELRDDYDIMKSHAYTMKDIKDVYMNIIDKVDKNVIMMNRGITVNDILNAIEKYNMSSVRKEAGMKGGMKGKSCIVTKKMKASLLIKYGLSIGQKFDSIQDMCDKHKITRMTITRWRKEGYIE